jgi:hypothetical protein
MTYDAKGLGISEMTFVSINYPDIWEEVWSLFDKDEKSALNLTRLVIEYHNAGLI